MKELLTELYEADLVLAVLTGLNANVWYELGIRHALRKGTIMMIEEGQKLPFDISQYGLVLYQDNIVGASAFEEKLKSFIGKIETNQPVDSRRLNSSEPTAAANTNSEYWTWKRAIRPNWTKSSNCCKP
jgi:hypothetical protein